MYRTCASCCQQQAQPFRVLGRNVPAQPSGSAQRPSPGTASTPLLPAIRHATPIANPKPTIIGKVKYLDFGKVECPYFGKVGYPVFGKVECPVQESTHRHPSVPKASQKRPKLPVSPRDKLSQNPEILHITLKSTATTACSAVQKLSTLQQPNISPHNS